MKPENIPSRKQPVSGEHIHAFDTTPPPSEREVRGRGHWRSASTDILINHPDGSNLFESFCSTDDNDIIRVSIVRPEAARSDSSSEQAHTETASPPVEDSEPLLPTDALVSIGSEPCIGADKRVWYRIPLGEYPDTHFFTKDGYKALAMPVQRFQAEQATAIMTILKVALVEFGYEEAVDSSTMLEFIEKPTGGATLALILFSDAPRPKHKSNQHPQPGHSKEQRNSDEARSFSSADEPEVSTELDHGSQTHGVSANQDAQTEAVARAAAWKDGSDDEPKELDQKAKLWGGTKPSITGLGAAVVSALTGQGADELNISTEATVELTAKVIDEVDVFKEQFGGKKLFAKMELEAEGQTCSKISEGVWPSNDPVEPPPPTSVTVKVICNGFKFNERVVYFNEVSEHRLTGLKKEAFFEQGMHLDLIRDCAGRPDRILIAQIREETRKNKVVCHLESLELIDSSGDDYALTQY